METIIMVLSAAVVAMSFIAILFAFCGIVDNISEWISSTIGMRIYFRRSEKENKKYRAEMLARYEEEHYKAVAKLSKAKDEERIEELYAEIEELEIMIELYRE